MTVNKPFVLAAVCGIALSCSAAPSEISLHVVWGLKGAFHGELSVERGKTLGVDTYRWEPADVLRKHGGSRVSWIGYVYNGIDGLQFRLRGDADTVCRLRFTKPYAVDVAIKWADLSSDSERIVPLDDGHFVAYGRGDVRRGPRRCRFMSIPAVWRAPSVPKDEVVALPAGPAPDVTVRLTAPPPGKLRARRASRGDGRLYVQMFSESGAIAGRATVSWGDGDEESRRLNGSLWLSVEPRIGSMRIDVKHARGEAALVVPTTLVETRGPKLLLNGEPFLVKGTLPRGLHDADARYLKSLGINTLRTKPDEAAPFADQHGFMLIASCHTGPGRICQKAKTASAFAKGEATYLERTMPIARQAAESPWTLIVQLGNEQCMGPDPWFGRMRPPYPFERLDHLLTVLHNAVRPLDLMLPLGYSNCAFGYAAPECLDVYLHNTYLDKDRNWPPIEEFMALQGCDRRPYIHTEFGANVYMPQAHFRAPNSPVLEKIHAWNYPNRWRTYLAAGTIGGTNYCLYDYSPKKANPGSWDKGFTNFGIMTFDRKPKLACWELWHLWRDFEIEPEGDAKLRVRYRRDCWARNCRLTVRTATSEKTIALQNFAPNGSRAIASPVQDRSFRWRLDYTTHRGLKMQATGACPATLEAQDFLERLKGRDTFTFLRELFDATVVTVDGTPAPPTLKEMEREDGVVPLAFRKPNGVVYLTAFTRRKPKEGLYQTGVDVATAFSGSVRAVAEMTGEPTDKPVEHERLPKGLRLKNIRVPHLPPSYGNRAREPIALPVVRIDPLE